MPYRIDQLTAITAANVDPANDLLEIGDVSADGGTGASRKISIQDLLSMASTNFYFEVSAGNVADHSSVNKFGRATDADADVDCDIWDRCNTTDNQDEWTAPTAARAHAIASTSSSDDGSPAGTGAQKVRVYGLTSWSSAETSEVVVMNGTSDVNTSSSYVIIHRIKVTEWGSAGPNVGTITATAATDGTVTAQINAGEGQTQMAIYGIPSGVTAYMTAYYFSLEKAATSLAANVSLLRSDPVGGDLSGWQVKHTQAGLTEGTSYFRHEFEPPAKFAGPCVLKLQVNSSVNNTDCSGGFDLVMVAD